MALIRSLGHAWDPTTNPNFPELLAFNACRCLLDEGIPMVMQADRPRDTAINDMYLVFDVAGKSFRLTDKGGAKDPMHLLHSFKNRVKHLHTASVRRTGKRWVQ